jgi:cation transport protein ChaC
MSLQALLWGVAFEIVGRQQIIQAMAHLNTRETTLGGYSLFLTQFCPRDSHWEPINVLTFSATSDNDLFLGPADVDHIAEQVITAHGRAGPNADYVTRLADYVREHIPEDTDEHLFRLDSRIRELLVHRRTSGKHHEHSDTYRQTVNESNEYGLLAMGDVKAS